jgi:hypothetical protein
MGNRYTDPVRGRISPDIRAALQPLRPVIHGPQNETSLTASSTRRHGNAVTTARRPAKSTTKSAHRNANANRGESTPRASRLPTSTSPSPADTHPPHHRSPIAVELLDVSAHRK